MRKGLLALFTLLGLWFSGCGVEGTLSPGLPPSTTIFVDTIDLSDEDRLKSRVNLRWQGYSSDDYIIGYKIWFGFSKPANVIAVLDTVRQITIATDSTFQFVIPRGSQIADLYFSVQAVSSKGLKDPNPPLLRVPIVNTPPTSSWDDSKLPVARAVQSVLTLPFLVDDFDGTNTIDSIQIRANFGPWISIPKTYDLVAIVPESPRTVGVQNALVYSSNPSLPALSVKLPNFKNGDSNRIEIRAVDLSGSRSRTDTTPAYFVKPQTSDLLVLEAYYSDQLQTTYTDLIDRTVYASGFDFVSFTADNKSAQPKVWSPTIDLLLGLYGKLFWYNDVRNSPDRVTDPFLLETLYNPLRTFERKGGKLLISCPFPKGIEALSANSPVFSLIPISSVNFTTNLAFGTTRSRMNTNRAINPVNNPAYPVLTTGQVLSSVDAFIPSNDADSLYSAGILLPVSGTSYTGPKCLAARKRNLQTGRVSQVFFTVELHKLNGNPQAIKSLFSQVLNNEFAQ